MCEIHQTYSISPSPFHPQLSFKPQLALQCLDKGPVKKELGKISVSYQSISISHSISRCLAVKGQLHGMSLIPMSVNK